MRLMAASSGVIFDFDGVLADSFGTVYAWNNASMKSIGKEISEEEFRSLCSENPHLGFRNRIRDEALHERFASYKNRHSADYYNANTVRVFSEMIKILPDLASLFRLAIVSAGLREDILTILRTAKIERYFDPILGSRDFTKIEKLKIALQEMRCDPHRTFFVSDTAGDIREGKSIGLRTIAVEWGYQKKEMLSEAHPDFFVHTPRALSECLLS